MKQTILPDRLLSCRNSLGLTQSEAAKLIGITQPAYQRYEAGVRTPSIQVAKEIAKAFNVSTAYLYGDSDQSLPDYFIIDKQENELLFSIVEQCRDFSNEQLAEILNNISKNGKGPKT
jgi:transcriptional regulator with XRE-family HTH domain